MMPRSELDSTYGRLTVLGYAPRRGKKLYVICLCDCGVRKEVRKTSLTSGQTLSCGCWVKEAATKHGKTNTEEFVIWGGMNARCFNPKYDSYQNYGGRGITVCARWRSPGGFENFLKDMGLRPSAEHSLDRYPNNDGNYEPGNVRWATRLEQRRGSRNNNLLTFRGETQPRFVWAKRLGIKSATIYARLLRGWEVEKSLTKPVQHWGRGPQKPITPL